MNSLKPHIAPTLHNAFGGLITAMVLAAIGGAAFLIKALRDVSVPLWSALLVVATGVAFTIALSKKKNQKHSDSMEALKKEYSDAMAELDRRHQQATTDLEQRYAHEIQACRDLIAGIANELDRPRDDGGRMNRLQELAEKASKSI